MDGPVSGRRLVHYVPRGRSRLEMRFVEMSDVRQRGPLLDVIEWGDCRKCKAMVRLLVVWNWWH